MIPIIQFDPATMALVYDVQLVGGADDKGEIALAVDDVVHGRSEEACERVEAIGDGPTRNRAIQIMSAMWHEKRHFLDFALTNYGAFRFRQFLDMYVNMPVILRTGQEAGVLHAPMEIYSDPVRCAVMGISQVPQPLAQIARVLARRRKIIERDRRPVASRFGPLDMGGEIQLECLALIAQIGFVQQRFGLDGIKRFYGSLYSWEQFSAKYLSLIIIAARLGVLPTKKVSALMEGRDAAVIDTTLLECIVFASLQTDHCPPRMLKPPVETSQPAERFAAICFELVQTRPDICSAEVDTLDFATCWSAVNAACQAQFGFSILEQMEQDHRHFEAEVRGKTAGNVPDELATIIADYFDLRARLLADFAADPALFVSSRRFTADLADRLHPNIVICASGGIIGDPPDGYDRLMGYNHDHGDMKEQPYLKWWWACAPNAKSRAYRAALVHDQSCFGYAHPEAWYNAMDFYAPIVKLLLNGRRLRTLIGPELLFAEQRMGALLNVRLEVFPSFKYPEETFAADIIYYYYGRSKLRCDVSSVEIEPHEARALYPWTLRRWPQLARYMVKALGDHDPAYFAFVRDWSPWIVSVTEFAKLKPLMRD